ncbi:alpha/beta hydrolase, partial [Clostridium perfringens]
MNEVVARNNVKVLGAGERTLMLAHGFGCDQNMWKYILPAFKPYYR